jgi:Cu(I)-responsive transcriptional regulator
MNIGQAASASGVSAKMIRYYESIDLVQVAARSQGGYRTYADSDVHVLRFIRQARTLGFPIEQIRQLLSLWQDRDRASAEVKAITTRHIGELDARIAELVAMRGTLSYLARHCSGDRRPHCPILEGIGRADIRHLPDLKPRSAVRRSHHDASPGTGIA